jgi:23S rRNA (uracil1939-C5)-methyltransferase
MSRHQKRNNRRSKSNVGKQIENLEVVIHGLSHDGRGIGRTEAKKVVFVEGALPGEHVKYTQFEVKKNFSSGVVTEVLKASEQRVEPKCKVLGKCGGCAVQHLNAEEQIVHKQQQLLDTLERIGSVMPENVLPPMMGKLWGYRRRARFGTAYAHTKKEVRIGFRAKNSHYIQPTSSCDIIDKKASDLLIPLKAALSQLSVAEAIPSVEICVADNTLVVIIKHKRPLSDSDEKCLIEFSQQNNVQLFVDDGLDTHGGLQLMCPDGESEKAEPLFYMHEQFDVKIEFGPRDFVQVNRDVNEKLVAHAVDLLDVQKTDRVLDLFCGVGNFTLPLARKAHYVAGVEGDDILVHGAKHNKKINQLNDVDFYYGDLYDEDMDEETHGVWLNQKFDKILLDPPRAGAIEIVRDIGRFEASKIVYISCDPATLSRDAKILVDEHGYKLTHAGVIDMFPQTGHVESIAVFERA